MVSPVQRVTRLAVGVVAFALFLALAHAVGRVPDPNPLMTIEASWVNHSTLVAWWFTWFGYAYVLVPACLVLVAVAIRYPAWRWAVAVAIVTLLLGWRGADFFQHLFARPRRLDWVVKHETAFSFPSSHAAIVTSFYAFLGVLVIRRLRTPMARIGGCLLFLLALGVLWSRLALAAHYATDLLGGILWGITVVAVVTALLPINVFEGPPAPSLE